MFIMVVILLVLGLSLAIVIILGMQLLRGQERKILQVVISVTIFVRLDGDFQPVAYMAKFIICIAFPIIIPQHYSELQLQAVALDSRLLELPGAERRNIPHIMPVIGHPQWQVILSPLERTLIKVVSVQMVATTDRHSVQSVA